MATKRICSITGCDKPHVARGWCNAHHKRWRRHGDPIAGKTPYGEPHAFFEQALIADTTECINWPFAKTSDGRSQIWVNGRLRLAARIICERAYGTPPTPQHEAAHSCGNGHQGCINPKHLRWATRAENQSDRIIHNTHNRGERNGQAKLTESDVLNIRRRVSLGETQAAMARYYGVGETTIGHIVRGESWAWFE